MPSLQEMAAKGSAKLARKAGSMAAGYEAAKARAITNFQAIGFGPTRVANYQAGVQAATYTAPDPAKWARNWLAKMAE
ncbi:hypothetical protein LCGC14_1284720 [marine sediment metagenome]|uniref:Uncharacterized protein n=1 Tax=marine sediment metagenome TaxID=412755 RepID=A0A0F9NXA9_9ZZZZ